MGVPIRGLDGFQLKRIPIRGMEARCAKVSALRSIQTFRLGAQNAARRVCRERGDDLCDQPELEGV